MMSVFVMLAIVCGVSSSALGESKVAVLRNGEIVRVIYKNTEPTGVQVTISDATGAKVFSEDLVSVNGFIRPYNFSEMPKGDYTICVTDVDGKKTEKVCFSDLESAKPASRWTGHISKLSDGDKKVLVAIPENAAHDFSVQVYDSNDQLLYAEDQKLDHDYCSHIQLKEY